MRNTDYIQADRHIDVDDAFGIVKGYRLDSVGTFLSLLGMTYPLGTNSEGVPVIVSEGFPLRDIEPDGDWMTNLSDEDRKIVEQVDGQIDAARRRSKIARRNFSKWLKQGGI
jgi:hypothetical protein